MLAVENFIVSSSLHFLYGIGIVNQLLVNLN